MQTNVIIPQMEIKYKAQVEWVAVHQVGVIWLKFLPFQFHLCEKYTQLQLTTDSAETIKKCTNC